MKNSIYLASFLTIKASILLLSLTCYTNASAQVIRPKLSIQLLINTKGGPENTADGVLVVYDNHFSKGIGYDDSYKFTNPDENLAINCNGTLLSMEGRPVISEADTLLLEMWQFRQKTYVFQMRASNFSSALAAVLKDDYLQTETPIDLTAETFIPFSLTNDTTSYALNRFSVVFKTKTAPPAPIVKGKFSLSTSLLKVFPNPVKGNLLNIKMNGMLQGRYLMNLYNTAGQQVYSSFIDYEGGSSTKSLMVNSRLSKGIYKLQLTLKGVTTSKMVLFQ